MGDNDKAAQIGIAATLVRNGALKEGAFDAAVIVTMDETGLDRQTIESAWENQRAFMRFCKAHGVIPDAP